MIMQQLVKKLGDTWNNCKKQFIVTKSDYHTKSRRQRLLSTSSNSSKKLKSSRASKRTKSFSDSDCSDSNLDTVKHCCISKFEKNFENIDQKLAKLVDYVSLSSKNNLNDILSKMQAYFVCNICMQTVKDEYPASNHCCQTFNSQDCLERWLCQAKTNGCPNCNVQIHKEFHSILLVLTT